MFYSITLSRFGVRRLWLSDQPQLVEYFQRLDSESRRLRFGGAVSDTFVTDYAQTLLSSDAVVFGAFPDEALRGVAELRGLNDSWWPTGELALLVEPDWQDIGIGEALFSRLIAAAQNRGFQSLHMVCLRENIRMRSLALKHNAYLEIDSGTVEAKLAPAWPTPMSIMVEIFGHRIT